MNIKGFGLSSLFSIDSRKKTSEKEKIRSESSSDRDADGRRQKGDSHQQEELTDEQIQHAIEYLENHPGVRDNHLTVGKSEQAGQIFLLITDSTGKVVRRIPQSQIHFLSQAKNDDRTAKGRLYDRAM